MAERRNVERCRASMQRSAHDRTGVLDSVRYWRCQSDAKGIARCCTLVGSTSVDFIGRGVGVGAR